MSANEITPDEPRFEPGFEPENDTPIEAIARALMVSFG